MRVSIVGAGELGATIAQKLAAADWPGEILLLDEDGSAAAGKALDLFEANPVLRSGTAVRGAAELGELEGSDYAVLADFGSAKSGELSTGESESIFRAFEKTASSAVILLAAGDPLRHLRLAALSGKLDPARILATSPIAFSSVWRHCIGRELRCSPRDAQVSLLGSPPRDGLYEVFASLAGLPLDEILGLTRARNLARSVGRPGPRNLASAAAAALMDMIRKNGAVHSCYVWAGGAYGARNLFLCSPSVIGSTGLERVIELPLLPRQKVTLARCLDYLSSR